MFLSNLLLRKLFITLLIIGTVTVHSNATKKVKIAFFINFMSVRGVEVSVYDYADCNETILGNESIIINNREIFNDPTSGFHMDYTTSAREKFVNRFGNRFFDCESMQEIDEILRKEKVDIFYVQKYGFIDTTFSKVCKNIVHAVFALQVHGNVYASISQWLSNTNPALHVPYVPYMVRLENTKETLHQALNIPHGAVIFGRHGGFLTFDINYAQEAVQKIAMKHPNWYFLFLNTPQFCHLSNVIFLPATADMIYKTKFINTCDVMIHARGDGETFGLACAEFSIKNKPIITCFDSHQRSHIDILGTKGFYYRNKNDLLQILESCGTSIDKIRAGDWDAYSKEYNPHIVMKKFNEVFIQPCINPT